MTQRAPAMTFEPVLRTKSFEETTALKTDLPFRNHQRNSSSQWENNRSPTVIHSFHCPTAPNLFSFYKASAEKKHGPMKLRRNSRKPDVINYVIKHVINYGLVYSWMACSGSFRNDFWCARVTRDILRLHIIGHTIYIKIALCVTYKHIQK